MSISIGRAAFAGFGLIGRRPLSVLVWGLVYLVVVGGPTFLFFRAAMPLYVDMFSAMPTGATPGAGPNPAMMNAMMRMQSISGFSWLLTIVGVGVRAVLTAAVFRAMLEPENKGFFYLRLGMAEVFQGLLMLAWIALIIVAEIILAIVVMIPVGVALAMKSNIGVGIAVAIGLVGVLVLLWVALRLSLAGPLTYADKTFRLFESWKFTKGHAGSLFAIILILIVIVWLIEVVLAIGAVAYIGSNAEGLKGFFTRPPAVWMKEIEPFLFGAIGIGSVLSGAALAVFAAPFASVYQQLKPPTSSTFA